VLKILTPDQLNTYDRDGADDDVAWWCFPWRTLLNA